MIRRIAEKIKNGIKFFIRHGQTNSHDNREPVGEIVSSYVKEIDGKLSTIAIGHFPKEEPVKEMDICSVEAEIVVDADDENIVGDVEDISAVALESSDRDNPAFPGAKRLATIQCFNSGEEEKDKVEKLTFDMVKTAIKDMNIMPWQLYTIDDLRNDREFGKQFEAMSTAKAENERLTGELDKSKKEYQDSSKKAEVATASARLAEKMKEDFTDLQKTFITKQFDPEKMESVSDEALDKFIEQSKKDFAETAKLFSVTEDDSKSKSTKEKGKNDGDKEVDKLDEALKVMAV